MNLTAYKKTVEKRLNLMRILVACFLIIMAAVNIFVDLPEDDPRHFIFGMLIGMGCGGSIVALFVIMQQSKALKDENKLRQTLARIEELIVEYGVEEIVLGLPKNMNATEGIRVELTNEFKEKLERRTGLSVHTWDERLTTVAADKAMIEAGIRREKRKDYVDMIAATFILQGYLDYRKNKEIN